MAKKTDLIEQNEKMEASLRISRKFIIVTLIGLGFTPDNLPAQFKEILENIDDALGIKKKETK